jgi:hypothetical protein
MSDQDASSGKAKKIRPPQTEDEFSGDYFLDTVAKAGWIGVRFNPSRTVVKQAKKARLVIEFHWEKSLYPLFIPTERLVRGRG